MSIRLNKALSELNIGLQTAVEFLEKRSELGEVKPELSFKLSDKQYTALVEAFKQDKEVRTQAEKLLQKKPKEKKRTAEQGNDNAAERPVRTPQQYKPLGKIDLDSIGKKPANKGAVAQNVNNKPKAQTAAVSQEPAKVNNAAAEKPAVKEASKPAEAPKKVEKVVATAKPAEEVKVAEKPITAQKAAEPTAPKATPKAAETPALTAEQKSADQRTPLEQKHLAQQQKSDDIFTTKSEKKMLNAPKVNVLGKIDLATLNQSTRPKKKSKEEKRKEREEKAQQQRDGKKKRERINKVRVDINAAANQQGNNRGGNNNGGGNSAGGNGGAGNGKKKKNRNRAPKPVEVSDEDVARQVKETLARLTNKQNQNKKGAKYRKEKREAVQEKLNEERPRREEGEQDTEAYRVCNGERAGYHDEHQRKPGYRNPDERRYHGVYQPAS